MLFRSGLLNSELHRSFGEAEFLGAPLRMSISTADGNVTVIIIAIVMIILMTASQFITQLQIMSRNQSAEMLPLVFLFSGFTFPLGVMFYWLVSNFWTMVQQFIVIRNMPTPGSEAALAREARIAKQRQKRGIVDEAEDATGTILEEPVKPQRQQPVNKNRARKRNNGKGK